MLLTEPKELPRQRVELQARAPAVDDTQKVMRVYLENNEFTFTLMNHCPKDPKQAEQLAGSRRLEALRLRELLVSILRGNLHGVPPPQPMALASKAIRIATPLEGG